MRTTPQLTGWLSTKTIAKKTQFLIDKKTGGYFFWEAGQDKTDDKSLLRTAADVAAAAL